MLSVAGSARAQAPLTEAERELLASGASVLRPQTVTLEGRRYVGGVVYSVVAAAPEELGAILKDADAMREILPRTQAIQPIARAGRDLLFELHQGNSMIHAKYTLIVRHEPENNRMRFWLDRSRPHALEDAWGFFRYEPLAGGEPRLLVTYGILMDLGPGLVRALYEERVRSMALTVPQRLREYVERLGKLAKRV